MEKNMNVVENKMDENRKEMEKKMDEVENKMDENRKEMEKHMENMLELQNPMSSMILHALDENSLKEISNCKEIMKM
jgi:uncharacterized membrane-anchored protein YhcB (DUF1043 family)